MILLDDFISGFDVSTLNLAVVMTVMNAYAPVAAPWVGTLISPQVLTRNQYNLIMRANRAQKQAEALVALDNINLKKIVAAAAALGMNSDPMSYKEAMNGQNAKEWQAIV